MELPKDINPDITPAQSNEVVKELSQNSEDELENRQTFFNRLEAGGFRQDEFKFIKLAYNLAKEAHRPQIRETGERYFEHVRSVALILMDECQVKDPDIIISAILHDSIEDSPIFGNTNEAFSVWAEEASFALSRIFNPRVSEMVISLTKPQVDGVELKTKEDAHHFYIENLKKAIPEVLLAKMSDRLHNLRTLSGTKPEKQAKIIKETREIYYPIFQRASERYPEQTTHMLEQMEIEMTKLEQQE